MLRAGEKEYRERLRNKDLEIAGQLDKIEVCVCVHMCVCVSTCVHAVSRYI